MPQKPYGQIGILEARSDRPGQRIIVEKFVHLFYGIVRIGIVSIRRGEIIGQSGQPRMVSRQVAERDRTVVRAGDPHRCGQQSVDWIVQRNLPALDHIRQQDRGKNLGNRTDLKRGVTIGLQVAVAAHPTVADDLAPLGIDHPDHDPRPPADRIDALLQDAFDRRVVQPPLRRRLIRGNKKTTTRYTLDQNI